jgi:spermidine/putrescine transport system substrate-binding protein
MEKMLPEFHPPYEWALDKSGEHLLGMTQRFGPFSFVVNTDKISRDMAEDQGFKLFLDPAMKDRYGVLTYDNWNIYHMCVTADIHPFREHTAEEIAYVRIVCAKKRSFSKMKPCERSFVSTRARRACAIWNAKLARYAERLARGSPKRS